MLFNRPVIRKDKLISASSPKHAKRSYLGLAANHLRTNSQHHQPGQLQISHFEICTTMCAGRYYSILIWTNSGPTKAKGLVSISWRPGTNNPLLLPYFAAVLMMNSFSHSNLHQRDPRSSSSLFDSYSGDRGSRPTSRSPATNATSSTYANAYPGAVSNGYSNGVGGGLYPGGQGQQHGYRAATPNSRCVLWMVSEVQSWQLIGDIIQMRCYQNCESRVFSYMEKIWANWCC